MKRFHMHEHRCHMGPTSRTTLPNRDQETKRATEKEKEKKQKLSQVESSGVKWSQEESSGVKWSQVQQRISAKKSNVVNWVNVRTTLS